MKYLISTIFNFWEIIIWKYIYIISIPPSSTHSMSLNPKHTHTHAHTPTEFIWCFFYVGVFMVGHLGLDTCVAYHRENRFYFLADIASLGMVACEISPFILTCQRMLPLCRSCLVNRVEISWVQQPLQDINQQQVSWSSHSQTSFCPLFHDGPWTSL